MMELADIRPGQQVLDVATGIGEPAVTAARLVGPSGRVIATDLSPQMIVLGRERVAELGLQDMEKAIAFSLVPALYTLADNLRQG